MAALLNELELQRDFLGGAALSSIYLGGGTPSLLEIGELEQIFSKITALHRVAPDAEITLEANPDDLTLEKLNALRQHTPVNRLSIGIQSFSDEDLRWMNRAHTAAHAQDCLRDALSVGFDALSVDLIYGSPTTSDAQWAENLRRVFDFGIPHLSCYCLTVEEGTALGAWVRKGQQLPVDEEKAARQFEYLMETAAAHGYEHYEISNFALPEHYARHNSGYWRGEPYLGIGPSAHSFDGYSRQWNVANNAHYIKALANNQVPYERETLTPAQRFNEYVMTSLRTMWGADMDVIRGMGGRFAAHFEQGAKMFLERGVMERVGEHYRLTRTGKFLADGIAADFFL